MTRLELKNIVKKYPGTNEASVKDFNLVVEPGEMVAFLGPSGCGKTTTLKIITGLIEPTHGEVLFDGKPVNHIPPEKREVSMVFQKSLLFPHMSVYDNVAFGLKMRKRPKAEIAAKVKEMLAYVKLDGYEKRRVTELSGGQEQRISLARGLVIEPRLFLLDEPLSALDASLRIEMRELILSIQRKLGITSIFVTHDQEEAVMLADKIALMFDGKLQQYDVPEKFYSQPKTKRVAEFFGCSNFIPGVQKGKTISTAYGNFILDQLDEDNRKVYLVARSEIFEECADDNSIKGIVKLRIFMGTNVRYFVDVQGVEFQVTLDSTTLYREGSPINLKLNEERLWAVPYDDEL